MKFIVHLSTALTFFSAIVGTFAGSQSWATSGIGGSGGGPRTERVSRASDGGQLVTVQVCDGGESGTVCHEVTYRVRPESKPVPVKCTVVAGEAGEAPCPKNFGVPKWLKRLNESFGGGSENAEASGLADYGVGP